MRTWSWMRSAAISQARTPTNAYWVVTGWTAAKWTPLAVRLPTRMGTRGGNVQRFGDIGPTA